MDASGPAAGQNRATSYAIGQPADPVWLEEKWGGNLAANVSAALLMLVRLEGRRISGRFLVIPPPLIRLSRRFSNGFWTWFDRHDYSPWDVSVFRDLRTVPLSANGVST